MTMPIDPHLTRRLDARAVRRPAGRDRLGAASGFGTALKNLLESVDSTNNTANQAVANMLDGTATCTTR